MWGRHSFPVCQNFRQTGKECLPHENASAHVKGPLMAFTLQNHVALVTGSSTGLGKAIAHTLGKQGAKVALNYCNNQVRAEKTLAEFRQDGIEALLVRCD